MSSAGHHYTVRMKDEVEEKAKGKGPIIGRTRVSSVQGHICFSDKLPALVRKCPSRADHGAFSIASVERLWLLLS